MQIDCLLQTCYVTRLLPDQSSLPPVICAMRNSAVSLTKSRVMFWRFITKRLPGAPGIHRNIHEFYAAWSMARLRR